jgi:uncharacterized membrane protein
MGDKVRNGLAEVLSDNAERILVGVLALAVVAALVVGGWYAIFFWGEPASGDPASWGQLGDYLGGVLNPVFGFLSVFALLVALVLQTRELKLSRESLKFSQEELKLSREEQAKAAKAMELQNKAIHKQSFEQTFFAWLGTYRQILEDVSDKEGARGRLALQGIWASGLSSDYIYGNRIFMGDSNRLVAALNTIGINGLDETGLTHYSIIAQASKAEWDSLYQNNETGLGSFFRVLYRLLKWIDEQPDSQLTKEDKWLYVGIVRSQLSWIEMVFLFYNGMTDRGAKFKSLIDRYALFDNLTTHSDRLLTILRECPMDSTGYAPGAFSSDIARGQ